MAPYPLNKNSLASAWAMGLLIVAVAYYFQIKPLWNQLTQLQAMKVNYEQQINQINNKTGEKINFSGAVVEQAEFLKNIFSLINLNGLSLFFLDKSDNPVPDTLSAHLALRGSFKQISKFLSELLNQIYPIIITDFAYQLADNSILLIKLDLLSLKFYQAQSNKSFQKLADFSSPFCAAADALKENRNLDYKKITDKKNFSSPLTQTNVVGYLQQGHRKQALVLLPNGTIQMIAANGI